MFKVFIEMPALVLRHLMHETQLARLLTLLIMNRGSCNTMSVVCKRKTSSFHFKIYSLTHSLSLSRTRTHAHTDTHTHTKPTNVYYYCCCGFAYMCIWSLLISAILCDRQVTQLRNILHRFSHSPLPPPSSPS